MNKLEPTETTYWFVYDSGLDILHMGITEPGQTTSTNAGMIEHGADIETKLEPYKEKLLEPDDTNTDIATPGFYLHDGKIIKLTKDDCIDKKLLSEVVKEKSDNKPK
jgi:hypothetical protein